MTEIFCLLLNQFKHKQENIHNNNKVKRESDSHIPNSYYYFLRFTYECYSKWESL